MLCLCLCILCLLLLPGLMFLPVSTALCVLGRRVVVLGAHADDPRVQDVGPRPEAAQARLPRRDATPRRTRHARVRGSFFFIEAERLQFQTDDA